MRQRTLLALILAALTAAAAWAAPAKSHEEKTLPAPSAGVAVEASFHDVEVSVKPGDTVRITVDMEISASSEAKAEELLQEYAPTYEEKSGTLTIRSRRSQTAAGNWGFLKMKGRISLEIPPGLALTAKTASGDISLSGDLGKGTLVAEVASGDVRVEGAASSIRVEAASGDFTGKLTAPAALASFDMASGDITLDGPVAELKADTASGSVSVTGLTGPAALEAASGDLSASWIAAEPDMEVTARTASGGIRLRFPEGTAVAGKAGSVSGTVTSDFPGVPGKRGNAFEFQGGPGAIRVEASTASGDIKILKASPAEKR